MRISASICLAFFVAACRGAGPTPRGTLTYSEELDRENVCIATFAVTASPYTGACVDCDYAFAVTSEVVAQRGDCVLEPSLTLYSPLADEAVLAYLSTQDGYDSLLRVGFSYPDSALVEWQTLAFDGSDHWTYSPALYDGSGVAATQGGELVWSVERHAVGERHHWKDCGDIGVMVDVFETPRSASSAGSLSCGGDSVDVWSFDVEAGEDLAILVDVASSDSAFDPVLWLNDPSGCTRVYADDNEDCSVPLTEGRCPYASIRADIAGAWTAVVAPYWSDSCTGDSAAYRLYSNSGGSPRLLADDVLRWEVSRTNVRGTLAISE